MNAKQMPEGDYIYKDPSQTRGWDIINSNPSYVDQRACGNPHPEAHFLGEFPMDCYSCHMYADS